MNIIIIEDEAETAADLKATITSLRPNFGVITMLDSVEESVNWLKVNAAPDLIFCDIQLGDGLAFEIFKNVNVASPVVFCTAYDEYMLQAFKTNGIDYLLKPLKEEELVKTFQKIEALQHSFGKYTQTNLSIALEQIFSLPKPFRRTFLVSYRDKLIPLGVEEICCFQIRENETQLFAKGAKQYSLPYSLDVLEDLLDPDQFCRANRQFIISRSYIKELVHHVDRRLLVRFTESNIEPAIVSKAKAPDFIKWVERQR